MPAAACVGDTTSHGGTITGPGVATVMIGGKPAAVLGDMQAADKDLVASYRKKWGLDLPIQHLIFDPVAYPTAGLPLATTEALQIEIGS